MSLDHQTHLKQGIHASVYCEQCNPEAPAIAEAKERWFVKLDKEDNTIYFAVYELCKKYGLDAYDDFLGDVASIAANTTFQVAESLACFEVYNDGNNE